MGKAQSKRSVDITTEVVADEGTGRVEKIEDVDQLKPQPQINGDTQHSESDNQKGQTIDTKENEHEKDLTTEKDKAPQSEAIDKVEEKDDENVKNSDQNEELNESKVNDTTAESSTTPDSSKKSKKDKLKKKWSFRSISFGKKDKQKPLKKSEEKTVVTKEEGDAALTVTDTNGESVKVPDQNVTEEKQHQQQESIANTVPQTTISEETKNEVEPVTNGESDITAQTPYENEDDKIPVESGTKTVSNGTTEQMQTSTELTTPGVENKDEVKLNGDDSDIEIPNIEVKSENEKLNAHSQVISDLPNQSQPPPLPISPQPSQVLSFALENGNDQQENSESKQTPNVLDVTPHLEIPSVIETAPTPEVEIKEDLKHDLVEENPVTISENVKENTCSSNTFKVDSEQEQNCDPAINNIEVINHLEDSNIESKSLEEIETTGEENNMEGNTKDLGNKNDDIQCTVYHDDKEEQIAESLVEEVTKTAAEIVAEKLSNEDLSLLPPSCLENKSTALNGLNGHGKENDTNEENLRGIPDQAPDMDVELAHKKNGADHGDDTSMEEIQNGVVEITKTIEEIRIEPEIKSSSTENSSPTVVTVSE